MKTAVLSSLEQKKAQDPAHTIFWLLVLSWLTPDNYWLDAFITLALLALSGRWLAQWQSCDWVPQPSKITSSASGQRIEWWHCRTKAGKGVLILLLLFRIGYAWSLWAAPQSSALEQALGVAAFVVFLAMGIIDLLSLCFPRVTIDETGIAGFQRFWWPRKARWNDITHYEVSRGEGAPGKRGTPSFIFKSGDGTVPLELPPTSLQGLNHEALNEIEAEIRSHLF